MSRIAAHPKITPPEQGVFVDAESDGAFLLSLLQASPDCIKVVEPDGTLSYMNHNGMCAMEIDDFGMVRGAEWCALWPEETRGVISSAVEMALGGRFVRLEAPCPTAKGTPKCWEVSVSPIRDAAGNVVRVLSVSRDVTERAAHLALIQEREAELRALTTRQRDRIDDQKAEIAHKDVALREVDHRVKNSLTMVSAILRAQARSAGGGGAELLGAANRVNTIAKVHGAIYGAGETDRIQMRGHLGGIADALAESLAGGDLRIEHAMCDRILNGDEALALGLIASELIANALRHAFPGGRGTVRLSCTPAGERTVMTVEDDGTGFPEGFDLSRSGGLGYRVVTTYAAKLDARIETGPSPLGGALVRVIF